MAERIIVESGDLWGFFEQNEEKLHGAYDMIAENQLYGIEIYATIEDDMPTVTVMADGDEVYSEGVLNQKDCADTAKAIYDKYLYSDVIGALLEGNDYEELEKEDMIEERERELDDAVLYLLEVFAPNYLEMIEDIDEVTEKLKDMVAEYLYTEHDISINRPMFLEDEDGNEEFVEFPYPELDLE